MQYNVMQDSIIFKLQVSSYTYALLYFRVQDSQKAQIEIVSLGFTLENINHLRKRYGHHKHSIQKQIFHS